MMNRVRRLGLAGAALAFAAAALLLPPAGGAVAAALPEARVAVVDYQRVLKQSNAGRDVHRQIDGYRKDFQAAVKRDEDKLREVEETLKRERPTLSPSEFDKRRRAFEDRVIALQRQAQDSMRALDESFQNSMNSLHKKLLPLVKELSEAKGYNVVVDRSTVAIVLKGLDLTDEVMEAFNKKVPKLKVSKPTTKKRP